MKDEIKLKDMTDFLENVYKDIKEQPTLEEEQKQEKEFINKIKGNNTNEIKEILDNTLEYLEGIDETRNTKILTTNETNILLDYITNLQEENERLKEVVENLTTMTANGDRKQIKNTAQYKLEIAQDRIKKAIEYIENNKQLSMFADLRKGGTHQYTLECDADDLLEILQGKSDE